METEIVGDTESDGSYSWTIPTGLTAGTNYTIKVTMIGDDNVVGESGQFTISAAPAGLVAYYPFNGNANDESTNNHNGTVNGATLTTDRFGNANAAYSFDGVDDYIGLPDLPTKEFPISVSAFFSAENVEDGYMNLYTSDKWDAYWADYQGFFIYLNSNGMISAGYGNDGNNQNTIQTNIDVFSSNVWYHLCVVYVGSNNVEIYLNGNKMTTTESNPSVTSVYDANVIDKIGGSDNAEGRHFFEGVIDDVRIYNGVLSQSEIQALYTENGWQGYETGTVSDIDLNTYQTVKIGTQWWMAENLKVTSYADGTPIDEITDNTAWANLGDNNTEKAFCYYNNNASNEADTYGALYTWAAAMNGAASSIANPSGVQGICPTGWHLPSDGEWTVLTDYLGSISVAGGKMKTIGDLTIGNGLWKSPNTGATNESAFSGPPGGYRGYSTGTFGDISSYGYWWSATQTGVNLSNCNYLIYSNQEVTEHVINKSAGISVRCVKN